MEYRNIFKKNNIILLIVLVVIGVIYHFRYDIYYIVNSCICKDTEGPDEEYIEDVETDEDEIVSINNLRYSMTEHCIYDKRGNLITDSVDWVYNDQSGECIVPYSRNGRRGFINIEECSIHILPKYDHAWVFREGLAAVDIKGSLFFIDENDKIKIKGYTYIPNKDFYFDNGLSMVGNDSLVGLIDKNGKWVISPIYDYIRLRKDDNTIHAILPNHRIVVFDVNGKKTSECFINRIQISENNPHVYSYESDGGWYGLINVSGKRISEPLYSYIEFLKNNIICTDENNKYDIYNKFGELLFKNINCVSVENVDPE